MGVTERELTSPWEGVVAAPAGGSDIGVLVLAGSSGRIERERARIFARHGFAALAIRWFGGPGQPQGICEVPLETFVLAVDFLRRSGARRIGILGTSKGAEAALLTAVHDRRVDVAIALSPTSRVWCNIGPGRDGALRPYRSSWTWRGRPLPFVPMDDRWTAAESDKGPSAIRPWYELSERTYAHLLEAATIPVETARADLLLVASGDDAMWPSLPFAHQLVRRRMSAAATVRLIACDDAGHRPRLPDEGPAPASPHFEYGGTPEADALLGKAAWPHVLGALRGGSPPDTSGDGEPDVCGDSERPRRARRLP
ncbi:acyl-CoA thioester hydrolase/BAAT C-terminal domain-containing protein [Streptomyces sp. NPDC059169]|uniref:acyl-CoA thioester hydrolase/BAAT C-terminal domain-containing protein n=1 Tax=Streptomyces sp. NPDC059169 TaxID=3346754 RepID=UPI0036D00C47